MQMQILHANADAKAFIKKSFYVSDWNLYNFSLLWSFIITLLICMLVGKSQNAN